MFSLALFLPSSLMLGIPRDSTISFNPQTNMAAILIGEVLSRTSDTEKISLLIVLSPAFSVADIITGVDFWHTKSFPKYGIPSIRFPDGPNGVRGTSSFNGVPAACFSCGTGLAAILDTKLLYQPGMKMGEESIAKGAHVLLGLCTNMQPSPLGGRSFEYLSER